MSRDLCFIKIYLLFRYNEYFIDRNREMFECVFNFYRTGDLSFPSDLPNEVIMDEVRFYWLENIFNHIDDEDEVRILEELTILSF